jgi:hypothetical protein
LNRFVRRGGLEPPRVAPLAPQSEIDAPSAREERETRALDTAPGAVDTPREALANALANEAADLEHAIVEATLAGRHEVAALLADRLRARLAAERSNVVPMRAPKR